jgi:nicotinate phosphoribosyltransferase
VEAVTTAPPGNRQRADGPRGTALLTDHYELTMLQAALRDGTSNRHCTFELFSRRLPEGRRYGVVGGTGRLIEAITSFRYDDAELAFLSDSGVIDAATCEWLAGYRFRGDVSGYAEGDAYFPGSPILTVDSTFAEGVVLETLALSILNHDAAVASAATRMVVAANGRPCIEMGSRRTHEEAAVASARAAYLAGFAATSNLAAGLRYGVPTAGTAAHAFTLLHDHEADAFRSQIEALGHLTTLLVDTYDIDAGIRTAIEVAGPELDAIRIDSGDLAVLAYQARALLDQLGATSTRIVLSGDLDEFGLAALSGAPVNAYGVGTSLVTGSGAPTAGFVYKLVEVDGRPVAKRSEDKVTHGGRKTAVRRHRSTGTAVEEVLCAQGAPDSRDGDRALQVTFLKGGEPVADPATLEQSRAHLKHVLTTVPWEGLKLSRGEPAIPTRYEESR